MVRKFPLARYGAFSGLAILVVLIAPPVHANGPMGGGGTGGGGTNYVPQNTNRSYNGNYQSNAAAADAAAAANATAVQDGLNAVNPSPPDPNAFAIFPPATVEPPASAAPPAATAPTADSEPMSSYVYDRTDSGELIRRTTVKEVDPDTGNVTVTITTRSMATGMVLSKRVLVWDPQGNNLSASTTNYQKKATGRAASGDPSAQSLRQQTLKLLEN